MIIRIKNSLWYYQISLLVAKPFMPFSLKKNWKVKCDVCSTKSMVSQVKQAEIKTSGRSQVNQVNRDQNV